MAHDDDVPPICRVVRQLWEDSGLTQGDFGALFGKSQQVVSKWVNKQEPTLDELQEMEVTLHRPKGSLVHAAGYIDYPATTVDMVKADQALTPGARRIVLSAYEGAVRESAAARRPRS